MDIDELIVGKTYQFLCYLCPSSPQTIGITRDFRYDGLATDEVFESLGIQRNGHYQYAFTCLSCERPNITNEDFVRKDFYLGKKRK